MSEIYKRTVAPTFEHLTECMQECTDFLEAHQAPPDATFAVNLVIEEIITNTIKYGYDLPGEHLIEVEVTLDADEVCVEIHDDGHAFDPFHQPEPDTSLPIEERPIGGLGIHLVKNMMDSCEYRREGDRNIMRVKKSLAES